MEILLELGDYKRAIKISKDDEILDRMMEELRGLVGAEVSLSVAGGNGNNFLQVWSNKWNTYLDVKDLTDICDGDRVKIVKRSTPVKVTGFLPKLRPVSPKG